MQNIKIGENKMNNKIIMAIALVSAAFAGGAIDWALIGPEVMARTIWNNWNGYSNHNNSYV